MLDGVQRLGEDVSQHVVRWAVLDVEVTRFDPRTDGVLSSVDVASPAPRGRVCRSFDGASVVLHESSGARSRNA